MPGIAAIILAAGGSSRLGRPKQLLPFRGRSLLRGTVEETLAAGCRPVIVVVGACVEPLVRELADLPVHVAENRDWREGIGASIRAGLEALDALTETEAVEGAVLAVCDQPYFSAEIIRRLVEASRNGSGGPVASGYGNAQGVPAFVPRALFPALRALRGDEGARKILRAHPAAQTVPFPEGAVDIDSADDWDALPR